MNKKLFCLVIFVFAVLLSAMPAMAEDSIDHSGHDHGATMAMEKETPVTPATLPETMIDVQYKICPIMGGEVNPDVATIHAGKVYHFCCEDCVETFKEDPEAVIAKIKDATEVTLTVTNKDEKCPVTGETAKEDIFLVRGDKITFYCCAGCVGKDKLESDESNKK